MAVIAIPAREVREGDVLDVAGQGREVSDISVGPIDIIIINFEEGGYVYVPKEAVLNVQRKSVEGVAYAALKGALIEKDWIYPDQLESSYAEGVEYFVEAVIQAIKDAAFEIRCTRS